MSLARAYAMKKRRARMAQGGPVGPYQDSGHKRSKGESDTEELLTSGVLGTVGDALGASAAELTPVLGMFGASKDAYSRGGKISPTSDEEHEAVPNYMDFLESHPEMQDAEPPQDFKDKVKSDNEDPHFVTDEDEGDLMAAGGYDGKSMRMIDRIMQKRKMARGGSIEDDFGNTGENDINPKGIDLFQENSEKIQDKMGYQHRTYLDDAYDSMENDPMRKKMAKGGSMDTPSSMLMDLDQEDKAMSYAKGGCVDRIMAKRGYSKGGMVANESDPIAEFRKNEFDDLALRDDLESEYTGENSGDELGDEHEDERREDVVSRIMRSLAKRDRMPRPA